MRLQKKAAKRVVKKMSEEEKEPTLWSTVCNFFKSLTLKVKAVLFAAFGIFGFISIFLFSKRLNERKILELELKKVRKQIEIEKAQEEIDKNEEKIFDLEEQEKLIREQIETLEAKKPRESVTDEELDDFFDSRGF